MASDLILAAEVRSATDADTATLADSSAPAQLNLKAAGSDAVIEEAAADKGYHAAKTIELCDFFDVQTYIPEPERAGKSKLGEKPEAERKAVVNKRRRVGRAKGKQLQRRRSEVVERTFAHLCETGGARRSHLRGLVNVTKRYRIAAAAAHNLGRILRKLTWIGKPRVLQGAKGGLSGASRGSGARWEAIYRRWSNRWANLFARLQRFHDGGTIVLST